MRSRRTNLWIRGALAALALPAAAEAGSIIHVDAAAPGGGDGTSWMTAFNDLQEALGVAVPNDQIWVAAGVYAPAGPYGDREASFFFVNGVPLFGGFAGWEEQLDERDWILNETILSGDLNGDDGPDFENNSENSYHVVSAVGIPGLAWLDGFTVTGGNANVGWYPEHTALGGGLFSENSQTWVKHCTLSGNAVSSAGGAMFAENGQVALDDCVIVNNVALNDNSAGVGGGVYCRANHLTMENCDFEDNFAGGKGGALRLYEVEDVTVTHCKFFNNIADIAGGIGADGAGSIVITGCQFVGNEAGAAAGALYAYPFTSLELMDCAFLSNSAWLVAGALETCGDYISVINCGFATNSVDWIGGAVIEVSADSTFINCAFSRNVADLGGGVHCASDQRFINCTFNNNAGNGITTEGEIRAVITNCIFWGNTPEQIAEDPSHPGGEPIVSYSDVQGGWGGYGNINADPLFVQPMADDLRLSFGSPCVNEGNNGAVPPYIETDILGNDRFIDGIVDMGAYEGEYEMLPPAAVEYDLDRGEFTILIPSGGEYDPLSAAGAMMVNETGPDDATAVITEYDQNMHPEAEGFSALGTNLQAETSLADGESRIYVFVPFDAAGLGDADPAALDVTYYDETAGTWALAVARNAGDSPGHDGPIGDRIVIVDGSGWGITADVGDWGVYWDPDAQEGFVWANVDYPGDFAFGEPLCPRDCAQPPDGFVDSEDLSALLSAWGDGLGPFDVNNDGSVDVVDLLTLLGSWGPCP